jgi:hypothetical protein
MRVGKEALIAARLEFDANRVRRLQTPPMFRLRDPAGNSLTIVEPTE